MRNAASQTSLILLPNLLTYGRMAVVPALVAALSLLDGATARWTAFGLFTAACVTDWLDGYVARAWAQQSTLGRMLDPIADKLLVGATLLMLAHDRTIDGLLIWAAVIILCREILVSGLREFLAGLNVKIRVTLLAKWKTSLQMVALGLLLIAPAVAESAPSLQPLGEALLWGAALLTLWTGYDYLKASVTHAMEPRP